jgi:prepilin-type N-terminal cleavage/methylation domain-containing protein
MKSKKTFTLIELICVMGLIAVISTILLANGLQMVKKIQTNKDVDKLSKILNEMEIKCLLTKEEGIVRLLQKKDFLEVELDYPSQKKGSKRVEKLKAAPLIEGEEQELQYHPYKGWNRQLNADLIALKDKK